ncbi:hypothetical protein C7476_104213 [Phyllobacterium bourgognense]|uniref:Uncharacterized protein n=1 Tax=Phyllobacterium bourgognense TaxID=314236 RepID=A0A368YY18_9HYPH|nr:hypothetical protein C7476_104213 [Phyllobacterium bourgognense]
MRPLFCWQGHCAWFDRLTMREVGMLPGDRDTLLAIIRASKYPPSW